MTFQRGRNFPVLGKNPAKPGSIKLKLADYIDKAVLLPKIPTGDFGHAALFPATDWGYLGNDQYGDCVWAGAAHETMLLNRLGAHDVTITTADALDDYSAVTGFKAADPSTDQGTDMDAAAKYRRTTGIRNSSNNRHKIAAYLDLTAGDIEEVLIALYLFECVGLGFEIPSIAMDQFDAGKPWDVTSSDGDILGGHYVPAVGRTGGDLVVVTYGQTQLVTPAFFAKYSDQAIAYLSQEDLVGGKSPEGFDDATLQSDLAAITAS